MTGISTVNVNLQTVRNAYRTSYRLNIVVIFVGWVECIGCAEVRGASVANETRKWHKCASYRRHILWLAAIVA